MGTKCHPTLSLCLSWSWDTTAVFVNLWVVTPLGIRTTFSQGMPKNIRKLRYLHYESWGDGVRRHSTNDSGTGSQWVAEQSAAYSLIKEVRPAFVPGPKVLLVQNDDSASLSFPHWCLWSGVSVSAVSGQRVKLGSGRKCLPHMLIAGWPGHLWLGWAVEQFLLRLLCCVWNSSFFAIVSHRWFSHSFGPLFQNGP